MSVTDINLLFTGRGGKDDFEKHRTYKRVYEVITDNPRDDEQVVGAAIVTFGIGLGASFSDDPLAVVVSVEAEQSDASDQIWLATIEYDSKPKLPSAVDPNGDTKTPADQHIDNPLLKPAEWRYASIDTEEPLTEWRVVDAAGNITQNAPSAWAGTTAYKLGQYVSNGGDVFRCVGAGTSGGGAGPLGQNPGVDGTVTWVYWSSLADFTNNPNAAPLVAVQNSGLYPFDPPAMEMVSKPMVQVTKNVALVTLQYLMTMKNAVNVIAWRGIPARCAKCLTIEADSHFENGFAFFRVTWHLGLDPETWDKRILDCGWGRKVTKSLPTPPGGTATAFFEFTDDEGNPYSSPVPMDGTGGKLVPGNPPVYLRGVSRQTNLIDFNVQIPV